MPCRDDGYDREEEEQRKFLQFSLPAVLCAILTVWESEGTFESNFAKIDWREAGVTPEAVEAWWLKHKQDDLQRRQREKAEAAKKLAKERKEYERLKKQFEGK